MILASPSFSVTNALPISMVLFLIGHDCDVHELFSWCCWCTSCVNHPLPSQSWSQCSSSLDAIDAFLISISFSYSMVVVMFMNYFLDAIDAFLVLMVFFLINRDHDVHELLSWCCWCIPFVNDLFLIGHDFDVDAFLLLMVFFGRSWF
jgi:hypothetical protein